ncbi:hypothetical protein BDN72DRAFT_860925 [Pluteus cervinus]|uniref:Uncharacterized protein n=1 Tax=Pluteus cervinus TaxID=181527 RepID=A0ACD3AH69_9AGAR|nr:hypothetical protein BDN72DRAFT_860925 [Pluteus cervinus]
MRGWLRAAAVPTVCLALGIQLLGSHIQERRFPLPPTPSSTLEYTASLEQYKQEANTSSMLTEGSCSEKRWRGSFARVVKSTADLDEIESRLKGGYDRARTFSGNGRSGKELWKRSVWAAVAVMWAVTALVDATSTVVPKSLAVDAAAAALASELGRVDENADEGTPSAGIRG